MAIKDCLAVIDATSGGDHVIRFAAQLAQQHNSYVSGLVLGWRPAVPAITEAWLVEGRIERMIQDLQATFARDVETVRQRFERDLDECRVEGLFIPLDEANRLVGLRARHADISIVSQARPASQDAPNAVIEACLFESGRPVIVVPPVWKTGRIGRTILVAWRPTREAARALADAAPLIAAADRVVVATVDARPSEDGYGEAPGADICAHLARGGANVELVNIASAGNRAAKAIEEHGLLIGADLVVMGGYGRSRFREFILGGVTRDMLLTSKLPILMAH
jgi:nucleotide-binding universal stress UspA family protein